MKVMIIKSNCHRRRPVNANDIYTLQKLTRPQKERMRAVENDEVYRKIEDNKRIRLYLIWYF